MANVFSFKGAKGGPVQPWSVVLPGGRNLRELYASRGDALFVGAHTLAARLDGPEAVYRFRNLTIGDGVTPSSLTASQRCKGLTLIVDGTLTVKAGARLHMTGQGARVDRADDPRFPFNDFKVPDKIKLSSDSLDRDTAMELFKSLGAAPWDRGFWDADGGSPALRCAVTEPGGVVLMAAGGGGGGGIAKSVTADAEAEGNPGSAGTGGGMGGGGSGAVKTAGAASTVASGYGGAGCPYGGGSGSGGAENSSAKGWGVVNAVGRQPGPYCGFGGPGGVKYPFGMTGYEYGVSGSGGSGGAGNPGGQPVPGYGLAGGNGVGGKLVLIVYGDVVVEGGGVIEANGVASQGAATAAPNGGGSGGGHVSIVHAGALAVSGTVQAAGGSGGSNAAFKKGGDGGAGSVVTKTFAQMGW